MRVKIKVCGVCECNVFFQEGVYVNNDYLRMPSHEIAIRICKLGPGMSR